MTGRQNRRWAKAQRNLRRMGRWYRSRYLRGDLSLLGTRFPTFRGSALFRLRSARWMYDPDSQWMRVLKSMPTRHRFRRMARPVTAKELLAMYNRIPSPSTAG